jgi:putative oxidoreductase
VDHAACRRRGRVEKITPIIDRTYPLAEAAQAHAYLESQRQTGKVLLLP